MKKLLIPVLIAVFAGVGGGSGFAYMGASKKYVADSTRLADSLKANPPAAKDSSAHASTTKPIASTVQAAVDSLAALEHVPMTPADSIRALEASRAALRSATKGLPDAKAPTNAPSAHAPTDTAPVRAAQGAHTEPSKPSGNTASVATLVRDARNEAMNTALPEERLSKIFAAMSAKDAAKVMEQMTESDVRSILALMSDRSAAAVLSQFPAARAAAITKGVTRPADAKPEAKP